MNTTPTSSSSFSSRSNTSNNSDSTTSSGGGGGGRRRRFLGPQDQQLLYNSLDGDLVGIGNGSTRQNRGEIVLNALESLERDSTSLFCVCVCVCFGDTRKTVFESTKKKSTLLDLFLFCFHYLLQ